MAKSTKSIFTIVLIATVAAIVGGLVQTWQSAPPAPPEMEKAILLPKPKALAAAQFVDHNGQIFQSNEFKGQWDIVFFGFTYCPDICPTTLYQLKKAKEELLASNQWGDLKVTMITVDPARDTPQRLAKYVPFFDADFVGLSGELDTIREFAKSVGVLFVTHAADENGNYDVDHTAALILLNPQGEFAGVISAPHKHSELVHDLAALARVDESLADNSPATMASSLELERSWIRPAPPGVQAMAAYLTVKNRGPDSVSIVGASSPMFDEIMIHTTTVESTMASMDTVSQLTIAPQSSIKLAPMGTHLMLMGPVAEFTTNDLVPITLELADGSTTQGLFAVGVPTDE